MPLIIAQDIPTLRRAQEFLMSAPTLGFDTEYTDTRIDMAEIVGAGFSDGSTHVYIPLGHRTRADMLSLRSPSLFSEKERESAPPQVRNCPFDQGLDVIRRVAQRTNVELIAHNMKAEVGILREYGIEAKCRWHDTMLCNWLLTGRGNNDLAYVTNHYFPGRNRSDSKFHDVAVDGQIALATISAVAKYCAAEDAGDSYDLYTQHFEVLLEEWGLTKVYNELEMALPSIIQRAERRGVLWDLDFLRDADAKMREEMEGINGRVYEFAGREFNLGSTQQLSTLMFKETGWWKPVGPAGASGHYSTAADVLVHQASFAPEEIGRVIARLLLRQRKLATLCKTFTLSLVEHAEAHTDKRIHTNFLQHGTDTGRFSSNHPNLQNIPRPQDDNNELEPWCNNLPKIRQAVIASPGHDLIGVDYSQIELRVMAHESRDPRLLEAYQNNEDIHRQTANQVGCSRQEAKIINFGLIYMMSPHTLAAQLGIEQYAAERYHKAYFQAFRGVATFHQKMLIETQRLGFVRTITGRFREVPNINHETATKAGRAKQRAAWRVAINTRIQGSAADLIKIALRNIFRRFEAEGLMPHVHFLLQVHDELMFESKYAYTERAKAIIQHEMENAVKLRVPLVAVPQVGKNWIEAH